MRSAPRPTETAEATRLRGELFTDLDHLAFALEMETADLLATGDEAEAARRQQMRLGVRLAQRLVAGVFADEVNRRLDHSAEAYRSRLAPAGT
jgi:hypothetical protein